MSRLKPGRRQPLPRLVQVLTAVGAGLLVAIAPAVNAHADPDPATIEKQIDEKWHQVEPIIEESNRVTAELRDNTAKVAVLQQQLAPLQAQVDQALAKVSTISAVYYKGGPASMLNALITTGRPTSLSEEMATLNALARNQADQIRQVVELRDRFEEQKKPLDALVAKASAQKTELEAKAKTINAEIATLNEMRRQAYGAAGLTNTAFRTGACPADYDGSIGSKAAQHACSKIGSPYVWAAEGPKVFDCSGLTLWAWAQVGVKLRHYTVWQYQETKRISRAELRSGDLIFFLGGISHVGMYVGNGMMVHAPTAGDNVRMAKIDVLPIYSFGRPG